MKQFEVEFKRTSFITYTVTAADVEEAEFIAYQELESDGYSLEADVEIESVEELK